jgi:hypothetical protein
MSKMYVIQWKSKLNGRAGKGTKVFEREAVEQLVAELNREYPQIEHRLLEVERDAEPSPPVAESAETPEPGAPAETAAEHDNDAEFQTVSVG